MNLDTGDIEKFDTGPISIDPSQSITPTVVPWIVPGAFYTRIKTYELSKCGAYIAIISRIACSSIVILDVKSGNPVCILPHGPQGGLSCMAFGQSKHQIASGSRDENVYIWDISSETYKTIPLYNDRPKSVCSTRLAKNWPSGHARKGALASLMSTALK